MRFRFTAAIFPFPVDAGVIKTGVNRTFANPRSFADREECLDINFGARCNCRQFITGLPWKKKLDTTGLTNVKYDYALARFCAATGEVLLSPPPRHTVIKVNGPRGEV